MSVKTYVVRSSLLEESWIVKAHGVKGAIVETLSYLKPRLENLENIIEGDIDLDLKVSEVRDNVTSIRKLYNHA